MTIIVNHEMNEIRHQMNIIENLIMKVNLYIDELERQANEIGYERVIDNAVKIGWHSLANKTNRTPYESKMLKSLELKANAEMAINEREELAEELKELISTNYSNFLRISDIF